MRKISQHEKLPIAANIRHEKCPTVSQKMFHHEKCLITRNVPSQEMYRHEKCPITRNIQSGKKVPQRMAYRDKHPITKNVPT